ncbi:MAG: DUF2437 domain-containing protein [Oscillospiraceae bacterium]
MKYLRFINKAGNKAYGIIKGNEIHEITAAPYDSYEETGDCYQMGSVKVIAPSDPRVIMCAGTNYMDHMRESRRKDACEDQHPQASPYFQQGSQHCGGPGAGNNLSCRC